MKLRNLLALSILIVLSSCVSKRKYNDTYALWVYTDSQYQLLKYKISNENKMMAILYFVLSWGHTCGATAQMKKTLRGVVGCI